MTSVVHVVHCVDTEGPLYESLEATFERVETIWGIRLKPSRENLQRLRDKQIDLGGHENAVAELVASNLLDYNDDWDKLNGMLAEIASDDYRNLVPDSFGNGWIYSWFCVDHVGYNANPRRRDIGYHKIFDRYVELAESTGGRPDGIHFHYHPMPISRSAHHCATSYFGHADTLYQSLARRIIDRAWFPCAFRPGFNVIRPDSHWFLEQYIPFDFSNQACVPDEDPHPDLDAGRFGDWRRAPQNWQPYHPAHADYQLSGACRRLTMRCLNVGTRLRLLRQADVDQAFGEAMDEKPVVLGFTHHDFRDMRPDIDTVRTMLASARARFPEVKVKYSEARGAVREALGIDVGSPLELELQLEGNRLRVRTTKPTFGSQPFLALKTKSGHYIHDNFDFQVPHYEWTYIFDQHTVPREELSAVGVASCDRAGNVHVVVEDVDAEMRTSRCF